MARLSPYFPESHGKPQVDDRRVLSGIIFVNRNGLRWRDAPINRFQDRAFDGVSFIVRNAGSLRQQGFEFDLTMAPSRRFAVTGSFAYLDSKFTAFANASNLPGLPGTQDLTGKPNTFSPKWSGNVAAEWSGDFGSGGLGWAINGNVSFVSDQFVGTVNDNNPQSRADGYALVGGRLSIHGADDRWTLSVFGRKLTNTHFRTSPCSIPASPRLRVTVPASPNWPA